MGRTKKAQSLQQQRIAAAEARTKAEQAQLRRLNAQQRRITDLSRMLIRAITRADRGRLEAARALCVDTGYGVFGIVEYDKATEKFNERGRYVEEIREYVDGLERNNVAMRARLVDLGASVEPFPEAPKAPATV